MTTTNTATKAKTVRRTTKITTKPYTPAALTRVYDKASGVCLGYLAPSRDGREYYQVTCDDDAIWHCTCKATIENCCHVKAAKELCAIRAKQGRPACRAASLPEPEMSEDDKELLAIVVEKMTADVTAELVATPAPAEVVEEAQPARELRNAFRSGDYEPEYREGDGAWQRFQDDQGRNVSFPGGCEDLAREFVAVDSDEHRQAVLAEYAQMLADADAAYEAYKAEEARKVAASEQRLSSMLNGRAGVLMPAQIAAPTIAARGVPMR